MQQEHIHLGMVYSLGLAAVINNQEGSSARVTTHGVERVPYYNTLRSGIMCGSCQSGTHSRRRLVHVFRRPIGSGEGLFSLIICTLTHRGRVPLQGLLDLGTLDKALSGMV